MRRWTRALSALLPVKYLISFPADITAEMNEKRDLRLLKMFQCQTIRASLTLTHYPFHESEQRLVANIDTVAWVSLYSYNMVNGMVIW